MIINRYLLNIFSLSILILLPVTIFWLYRDLNKIIISYDLLKYATEGYSDLGRYNDEYYFFSIKFSNIFTLEFSEKMGYYSLTYFLYHLGLSFKFFLYSISYFYFLTFMLIFHKLTFSKQWYLYAILFILISFWMIPLVTVALPQGCAFLLIFYFFFKKEKISFIKKIIIIFFASTLHFSSLLLIPYIFMDRIFLTKIKLLDLLFITIFILYVLGVTKIFSEIFVEFAYLVSLDIGALANTNETYVRGFSILKAIAILIPAVLFRLTSFINSKKSKLGKRMYIYYLYISIVGMLLCELPYHDRLLLFAWGVSPILVSCFAYDFLKKISKKGKEESFA